MIELVLYAPNVHTGGGGVLLKELLLSVPKKGCIAAILDKRIASNLDISHLQNVEIVYWVKPTFISRIFAELILYKFEKNCKVFCFHNIPPILNNSKFITVFFQNKLIVQSGIKNYVNFKTLIISRIERFLNIFFNSKVKTYIVQTESMKRELKNSLFCNDLPEIKVLPFLHSIDNGSTITEDKKWDFIYISSGDTHKNHLNLIEAWKILASENIYPSLALTIDSRYKSLCNLIKATQKLSRIEITNLGNIDHNLTLKIYAQTKALIYPSKSESFGLPLLEATILGTPIIAAELDYVRDVCDPVETFDPNSPTSIARSVKRFLGTNGSENKLLSAREFWKHLF
jgi:glycosyltransferase involved in cell wall biosynthesis